MHPASQYFNIVVVQKIQEDSDTEPPGECTESILRLGSYPVPRAVLVDSSDSRGSSEVAKDEENNRGSPCSLRRVWQTVKRAYFSTTAMEEQKC